MTMTATLTKVDYIRWFSDIELDDIPLVGGKNASLGEMVQALTGQGVKVPNGFAITAEGYRHVLHVGRLAQRMQTMLADLNTADLTNLAERGRRVRYAILATPFPADLQHEICEAYVTLGAEYGTETDVAVRSSATASPSDQLRLEACSQQHLSRHTTRVSRLGAPV